MEDVQSICFMDCKKGNLFFYFLFFLERGGGGGGGKGIIQKNKFNHMLDLRLWGYF